MPVAPTVPSACCTSCCIDCRTDVLGPIPLTTATDCYRCVDDRLCRPVAPIGCIDLLHRPVAPTAASTAASTLAVRADRSIDHSTEHFAVHSSIVTSTIPPTVAPTIPPTILPLHGPVGTDRCPTRAHGRWPPPHGSMSNSRRPAPAASRCFMHRATKAQTARAESSCRRVRLYSYGLYSYSLYDKGGKFVPEGPGHACSLAYRHAVSMHHVPLERSPRGGHYEWRQIHACAIGDVSHSFTPVH